VPRSFASQPVGNSRIVVVLRMMRVFMLAVN
jgi:hypothetical protein